MVQQSLKADPQAITDVFFTVSVVSSYQYQLTMAGVRGNSTDAVCLSVWLIKSAVVKTYGIYQ